MILLRLSPYVYVMLVAAFLISGNWLEWTRRIDFLPAFLFGVVLLVVTRVLSYVLMIRAARGQRQRGEIRTGGLGELSGFERPANETRVRDALQKVAEADGGGAPWVSAAVEDWLTRTPGAEKDRKRDDLLRRLYDEAGSPARALAQNRALNQLRLAINPWIEG